jgi:hypothetical protein
VVWAPGVGLFGLHHELLQVPMLALTLLVVGAVVVVGAQALRRRRLDLASGTYLACALTVFGFVVFSSLLFYFRFKETQAVFPLLAVLVAVALTWLVRWLVARFDH